MKKSYTKFPLKPVAAFVAAALIAPPTLAQQSAAGAQEDEAVEKIQVVGTHIKGGQVAEALAISVLDAEAIEILGVDSLDELLEAIPENGQNFFNEAENIGGGVNAARGDVGAYNLRNLGTGNTLVLLNGRRMVNAASYQTEEVGGSFVPVNSVNVNTIPTAGLQRVEVLRDGASAIYGADAVSGVVNHVVDSDYVGFQVSGRWTEFDNIPRDTQTLNLKWGQDLNDGRTNVSVFANYYQRDRVNSQDDPRWADSDFRRLLPEGSPYADTTLFRNDSANSLFGQFDLVTRASSAGLSGNLTDSAGEFEVFPAGDPRCEYAINANVCGAADGNGTVRYNLNENRDLSSELDRTNLFLFINHDFDNGVQSFTEASYYRSNTNLNRHPTASFTTSRLRVGANNFYNPLGPIGSPNRLDASLIPGVPDEGLELTIDNYRYAEVPRIVDNNGTTIRLLQGFRGSWNDWDWETALTYSKADKEDITRNRVSNTLMQEALNDPTAAAYNPFSGGVNSNIERALIDVRRDNETDLKMFDIKFANSDIFELPGGPVGLVIGFEYREESFIDNRDDRLDGTIAFTDFEGDTFPFVSDVVNSSPTPDSSGEREVTSLFTELQIPVLENLNIQAALRYEDFSDVGTTTVGKIAFGWRPLESVLLRGSWSEAFRAPNLITINESIVARNNTRDDYACQFAALNGGDPDENTLDCRNSIQRIAQGSQNLQPETSENISLGIVLTPTDDFTVTLDYWSIEKEDTIGLFGEENHTLLDLLLRIENGNTNCDSTTFNPAVTRAPAGEDEAAIYNAAGICPAGDIEFIDDRYANLDKRTVAGFDLGVYWDFETQVGDFGFSYNASLLDKYEQEAGGDAALLVAAQENGVLPASFPIDGFADLIGRDGNQEKRQTARLTWRQNDFGASLSATYVGDFYQSSLTLDDGTLYTIPSMTRYNATFDYRFDSFQDSRARLRFGVRNLTNERAPLADRFFGFFSDAHNDFGRSYYVDLRMTF
ncbi:TonB-dependent receptor [Glaciecola sp. XM2]|uniref:TonB-dependent receptor domain-containing protein n=1 Tax=Glaciecola sp. XM2 TaxID=1914931 RepID=UPI001BDF111E|nr:TonB-dependent receptor [Glaciecola sp. XM2]MBT1451653.1 TonB-dependent receptor [Glaciecola sp. XM2]